MEDRPYGVISVRLYGYTYFYRDYGLRDADTLIASWNKARTVRAFAGDESEKIDKQTFFYLTQPSDTVPYSAVLDVDADRFTYRSHTGIIVRPLKMRTSTLSDRVDYNQHEQHDDTIRLFVDMDGVLAEYRQTCVLEDLYEEGYFYNLRPQEQIVEAIKAVRQDPRIEVFILSSVLTDSPYALVEKKAWLSKYLPEIDADHQVFPPCGKEKWKYVPGGIRSSDCLLDDYTKNLVEWEPQGNGIKLLNGINHSHETWKGAMVSINSPANELINDIKSHVLVTQSKKIRL